MLLSALAGSLFAKTQFALEVEDWGQAAAAEKWLLTSAVAVVALAAEYC